MCCLLKVLANKSVKSVLDSNSITNVPQPKYGILNYK